MATPLFMPSLSPTMEEGIIAKWNVKVGEKIAEGTNICSVETDKTTVDYESLDEGFLRELLVEEGEKVKVNQLIGILTDEADEDYVAELEEAKKESKTMLAKSSPKSSDTSNDKKTDNVSASQSHQTSTIATPTFAPIPTSVSTDFSKTTHISPNSISDTAKLKASPLAKKIALNKGIPLNQIKGSGPGGRIIKADVENYVPTSTIAKSAKPNPADLPASYGSLASIKATENIPVSGMMRTVGKRLLESYLGAPAFFVTMKIYVDEMNSLRKKLNQTPGYKISVNDIVVKAVAANLRAFPRVNASFHEEHITQHSEIDIAIAVALPDGLITPIVRNADQKGLGYISAEIKSLVSKAKKNGLSPQEYQGGTFSISNMGMFEVSEFTSLINPPHSAILAVAGTQSELYKTEKGEINERNFMNVTLTSDHRVINGALAAEFLGSLKKILENPVSLIL